MSGDVTQGQSRGELETARALNTVAIIGATHPMVTATRQLAGYAPDRAKRAAGRLVPAKAVARGRKVVDQAATRNPGTKAAAKFAAKHGKVAGAAAATGWLGFHGAELAGDFMGRRSINAQLEQKKVKKMDQPLIEQSYVSKAQTAPVTGHGTNIEKMHETVRPATRADRKRLRTEKPFERVTAGRLMRVKDDNGNEYVQVRNVTKRYYDSEADRQRRLGAAAGVLGGTSIVTGAAAARGVQRSAGRVMIDGKPGHGVQIGVVGGKKAVRTKAGLAALAAVSGAGAIAAYKRGISRRNQTWQ